MAKEGNSLGKLNGILFGELERLCDVTLNGEELKGEIERSKAVSSIARDIIANGRLSVDASRERREGSLAMSLDAGCRNALKSGE